MGPVFDEGIHEILIEAQKHDLEIIDNFNNNKIRINPFLINILINSTININNKNSLNLIWERIQDNYYDNCLDFDIIKIPKSLSSKSFEDKDFFIPLFQKANQPHTITQKHSYFQIHCLL